MTDIVQGVRLPTIDDALEAYEKSGLHPISRSIFERVANGKNWWRTVRLDTEEGMTDCGCVVGALVYVINEELGGDQIWDDDDNLTNIACPPVGFTDIPEHTRDQYKLLTCAIGIKASVVTEAYARVTAYYGWGQTAARLFAFGFDEGFDGVQYESQQRLGLDLWTEGYIVYQRGHEIGTAIRERLSSMISRP